MLSVMLDNGITANIEERSGVEWDGVGWKGVGWSGVGWSGMECSMYSGGE